MMSSSYHNPVMLQECIEGLNIQPSGKYVDVTFGGGGHSKAIFNELKEGQLFAFDQDKDAEQNAWEAENFEFINENFAHLKRFLMLHNGVPVNGILADLGVSSFQIDEPIKGFSYRFDAPLDMRMSKNLRYTAADIINNYTEKKLLDLFTYYGEIRNSKTLASHIVQTRLGRRIETTTDLVNVVKPVIKGNPPRYLSQLFQSLRIEVNKEIEALQDLLVQALDVLDVGGRLVVMSYHSLEDRLVKNFMKYGTFGREPIKDEKGQFTLPFKLITKKPVMASEAEVERNPRARSARLRIAEKV